MRKWIKHHRYSAKQFSAVSLDAEDLSRIGEIHPEKKLKQINEEKVALFIEFREWNVKRFQNSGDIS